VIHDFSAPIKDDNYPPLEGFIDLRSDVERQFPLGRQGTLNSPDIGTASAMATEAVAQGGNGVEVYLRTDNADYDKVWDEDPDPTYWASIPAVAAYEPKQLEVAMKGWNLDATVTLEFVFPYDYALALFGRLLRKGDVVFVPFNAIGDLTPKFFRLTNVTPTGPYRYRWMYINCSGQNCSGDITVLPERISNAGSMKQGDL
jgi:hypothetical protein